MIYLLLGEELKAKDAFISNLKSSFKSSDAKIFDIENLDAMGLAPDALKKALISIPVFNAKRLVIVQNVHKLKVADIAVLEQYVLNPDKNTDLILSTPEASLKVDFKEVMKHCTPQQFSAGAKANVFDMTKLMASGRQKDALNMLSGFYKDGTHPLQILGGLAWFWGKDGRRLPAETFEMGLKALEAADVNIKRSRLDGQYAVEKVVVELSGLLQHRR